MARVGRGGGRIDIFLSVVIEGGRRHRNDRGWAWTTSDGEVRKRMAKQALLAGWAPRTQLYVLLRD